MQNSYTSPIYLYGTCPGREGGREGGIIAACCTLKVPSNKKPSVYSRNLKFERSKNFGSQSASYLVAALYVTLYS